MLLMPLLMSCEAYHLRTIVPLGRSDHQSSENSSLLALRFVGSALLTRSSFPQFQIRGRSFLIVLQAEVAELLQKLT